MLTGCDSTDQGCTEWSSKQRGRNNTISTAMLNLWRCKRAADGWGAVQPLHRVTVRMQKHESRAIVPTCNCCAGHCACQSGHTQVQMVQSHHCSKEAGVQRGVCSAKVTRLHDEATFVPCKHNPASMQRCQVACEVCGQAFHTSTWI